MKKVSGIKLFTTIILTSLLINCDPGYNCDYYLKNNTNNDITYLLYWRDHNLDIISGTIFTGATKLIMEDDGLGYAYNQFPFQAETLYINDSLKINVCDERIYEVNKESKSYGKYTLVLTDSIISAHQLIGDSLGVLNSSVVNIYFN